MKRTGYVALVLFAPILLGACGGSGGLPTGPSPAVMPPPVPSPVPPVPAATGDITIRSITPATGATLRVRECENGGIGFFVSTCADQLRMTFDALIDRDIPNAVLTASFYDRQLRCGSAYSSRTALAAGSRAALSTSDLVFSYEADDRTLVQPCPLPSTTTRIVVQLWGTSPATPLLTREFAATYTFAAP